MKKSVFFLLAFLLLFSLPLTPAKAAGLTTEQKFEVLKNEGIFAGFSDGSPRLYQSMTREQFAQVLFTLYDLSVVQGSSSYNDVLRARWSYPAVEAVTHEGLMVGVGTRRFDPQSPVTVEQLAAVLVRSAGWTGGNVLFSGKVSAWARTSVGIALQNELIPQMKDYTKPATRGLLVDAIYAVYVDLYRDPIVVSSVEPVANQIVRVNLVQSVSSVNKSRFQLKDIYGIEVNIRQVISDGKSLTVVTDPQVANRDYRLYIDNSAWPFKAYSDDRVKPFVAAFNRTANGVLLVTFSEPVDRASAATASNYTLNNGLRLTGIQVSDDNRTVTLTTTQQINDRAYSLTVRNVKDAAGNVMDPWSTTFLIDNSVPTAAFGFNDSTAVITLTFSEKINAQQAVNLSHYTIDKGVAVVRADLDANGRTVYLTTSAQKDATLYTLTVSGIPDLAGNVMANQSFTFGGVANPAQAVQLQSVGAENDNTVLVTFNRALSDDDVNKLGLAILSDNGNTVTMSGWQAFKIRKAGSDRAVTVQFRTSGDGNPELFKPGHVYVARVTGIPQLVTLNNANQQSFAGTQADNPVPQVTKVEPINATSVKVFFSEPVKNVSELAFMLKEKDIANSNIRIANDSLNGLDKVATEVVLTLTDPLQAGHLYVMTFKAGTVTDAAGWNGWRTQDGTSPFAIEFRGV